MAWDPDLVTLRLLRAVGEGGSISDAARSEGLSQPAASKRLSALERALGVTLVVRTSSGSSLTPEGRVVADWAGRVFEMVTQMSEAVATMREHSSADLRVAASMTVAEHLVPRWLSSLRTLRPDVHVGLRVANSHDVQRLVIDGEFDLGLIETGKWDDRLRSKVIGHDRLTVVVAPGHPWARRRKPLAVEELAAAQLIVRESGSGTRETLDRLLGSLAGGRVPVEPLLEMGSNAAVKGAVKAGVGPAVLSELAVREELSSGQLCEVSVTGIDFSRPLRAVWPRAARLGPSSSLLLALASRS